MFPIRLSSFSLSSLLLLLLIISFSCSSFDYWFKIKLAQGRNVSYIIIVCVFFSRARRRTWIIFWITHDCIFVDKLYLKTLINEYFQLHLDNFIKTWYHSIMFWTSMRHNFFRTQKPCYLHKTFWIFSK